MGPLGPLLGTDGPVSSRKPAPGQVAGCWVSSSRGKSCTCLTCGLLADPVFSLLGGEAAAWLPNHVYWSPSWALSQRGEREVGIHIDV